MTCRTFATMIGLVLTFSIHLLAADDIPKLPDDGWWIRYRYSIQSKLANGNELSPQIITQTISFVGTTIEDGERCRWVERKKVNTIGDREYTYITKHLIPEKSLLESPKPLESLRRGWTKANSEDAVSMGIREGVRAERVAEWNLFSGFWKDAEVLQQDKTVQYQQGRLTISEAKRKKSSVSLDDIQRSESGGQMTIERETIAWFDRTTFPVFAAAAIKSTTMLNGNVTRTNEIEVTLEDMGHDAQSLLPDNN